MEPQRQDAQHVDAHERPLVSICFPTVGRMDYLADALGSIRAQNYPAVEVLILDNASPPETAEVLRQFVAEHPSARHLRVDTRVPMFANFNRGIQAARGKYVAFFHDDDTYAPDFLTRYVELLEARPAATFAGGNYSVMDASGTVRRIKRRIRKSGYWTGREFIEDLVTRGRSALSTPGLVFRHEAIAPGGFDESLPIFWGDFPILMRLAAGREVAVSSDVQYSWRVHGHNWSNQPWHEAIPLRTRILTEYLAEYRRQNPGDESFVRRLEERVRRGHRRGLLWGWFTAGDPADAAACLAAARDSLSGRLLGAILALVEAAGLSLDRRRGATLALRDLSQRVGS